MNVKRILIPLMVGLAVLACSATPVFAAPECSTCKPWWRLTSGARPTVLPLEGSGEVVLTVKNFGDGEVNGAVAPVQIKDTLPPGLTVKSIGYKLDSSGPLYPCSKSTLTCTFEGSLRPYALLEVRIGVEVKPSAEAGEVNAVTVSGGGAPAAELSRPIAIGESTPFGLEEYGLGYEEEGGAPATQAGSHPFQQTVTLGLNQLAPSSEGGVPAAIVKDVAVQLPPGAVGNPSPLPTCSLAQFLTQSVPLGGTLVNECSPKTAVGVAAVTVVLGEGLGTERFLVPLFNLEPYFGEPARFGFLVPAAAVPVLIDTAVRSGGGEPDYGITASTSNVIQSAAFLGSEVVLWGTPGDPRHDASRGWGCLLTASCPASEEQQHPPAFLTMPTSCSGPMLSSTEVDSWLEPQNLLTFSTSEPLQSLDGCNQLLFKPTISAEPTTDRASAPSGLDFNLDFKDEGLVSPNGKAQSQLKDTVVTLPEGFTINPSAGVGLGGCTPADYARETLTSAPGAGCPNDSKLGTVEVTTPLLSTAIHGSLFIAQPYENPFSEAGHPNGSLVAIYIVLKNPEKGILIKLPGKVTPNPVTGQLTATFLNNPQLPFDHFNFHFREGQQAPLITPATCGTYTTQAQLTPWSEPTATLTDTSTFTITNGFEGGACPSGGVPPFHPGIQSGMLNNNAGVFSPFYLHLTRTDGEQEISGFSTNLPPGLTGNLTGIPFCPEADIALARTKTGVQEEAEPSCPATSQIGHTLVGTGVGAVLAYVPGKIYLAGPFDGAPFSIVSVTSAVVGPFDLGTVVLRFGLDINPYTAQVSVSPTTSEPIPTIIDGIVTHVRDIRVYINRPNFTLNPTSCAPMVIGSTLNSNLGASATITSPFQAASCANLKFAPKFAVSASPAKDTRLDGASLHVNLSYPNAPQGTYANIARVKVELPKQLPSRLTTLRKACTAQQFDANPAGCPPASKIGMAVVHTPILPVPLEGPAIFVSHGGEAFPSLTMVLQGDGITIDLVGTTFISKAGVTSTTFKTVPDDPVGSFELTLPQGEFSALTTLGNLCKQKLTMPTEFLAQNGAEIHEATKVTVTGCKKPLTRAQKLAAASKACKKKAKGKRAACEAKAHKRFGPVKKK